MPVAVGPYGQSQPSCFDRVKMGFVMGCAVGMAAGALFGTFSCLRIGMRGRELMGGIGKTMMQIDRIAIRTSSIVRCRLFLFRVLFASGIQFYYLKINHFSSR